MYYNKHEEIINRYVSTTPATVGGKWNIVKALSVSMSKRLAGAGDELKARAQRMRQCATLLQTLECPHGHHQRVTHAHVCRDRLCPVCNWLRARKLAKRIATRAAEVGGRYIFVTLTVPNVGASQLRDEIKHISKSFGKLIRRPELSEWTGYARTIEITYNPATATYHPHIHALIRVPESYFRSALYVHRDTLSALWAAAVDRDISPAAQDIRAVTNPDGSDDPTPGAYEVAKYAATPSAILNLNNEELFTFAEAIKGVRLFSTGGALKTPAEAEDIEAEEEQEQEADGHGDCRCPECGSILIPRTYEYHEATTGRGGDYKPSTRPPERGRRRKTGRPTRYVAQRPATRPR